MSTEEIAAIIERHTRVGVSDVGPHVSGIETAAAAIETAFFAECAKKSPDVVGELYEAAKAAHAAYLQRQEFENDPDDEGVNNGLDAVLDTMDDLLDALSAYEAVMEGRVAETPVAWRYRYEPGLTWHVTDAENRIPDRAGYPWMQVEPLYAAPSETPSPSVREAALEEAAKIADEFRRGAGDPVCGQVAAAIRALRTSPVPETVGEEELHEAILDMVDAGDIPLSRAIHARFTITRKGA